MIASERDARQAGVQRILGSLDEIRQEIVEADSRTAGFEAAVLDALGRLHDAHVSLESRVSDLEKWRRDQAS